MPSSGNGHLSALVAAADTHHARNDPLTKGMPGRAHGGAAVSTLYNYGIIAVHCLLLD